MEKSKNIFVYDVKLEVSIRDCFFVIFFGSYTIMDKFLSTAFVSKTPILTLASRDTCEPEAI